MAVIKLSDENFSQAIRDGKVIVKYYADWCGTCRLLAPKFKRISEDPRFNQVTFAEVNAEENENARKKAGVSNLPFIALFENGELKNALATSKEEAIVDMLETSN